MRKNESKAPFPQGIDEEKFDKLSQLAEMGKLLAETAHELSQPLAGIKAFTQMLRKRYDDDDFLGPKLRLIEKQARHMEAILDSVKTYSHGLRTVTESCAPREVIESAMLLLRNKATKARVEMELRVPAELPTVEIPEHKLQQVLLNLMNNAIEAMKGSEGSKLVVEASESGKDFRLAVADTGPGIPGEVANRVFEPFFTTKKDGSGLGLAICKRIARQAGGDLRLLGQGECSSRFGERFRTALELSLPLERDAS